MFGCAGRLEGATSNPAVDARALVLGTLRGNPGICSGGMKAGGARWGQLLTTPTSSQDKFTGRIDSLHGPGFSPPAAKGFVKLGGGGQQIVTGLHRGEFGAEKKTLGVEQVAVAGDAGVVTQAREF